MKLSIIVPVYNVKNYLEKCLQSLLDQGQADYEIVLVDDGSTDGVSGAICDDYAARYPDRIRVFHKPNGGLGDARNYGIREAYGEYLLFVDSDDYIAPETVSKLSPWMEKHIDILFFGLCTDTDGVIGPPQLDGLPADSSMTLETEPQLLLASPNVCNKLWRRALFTENDIQFPGRAWYEDAATTGKLLERAQSVRMLPETLYYYVVREGSITRNAGTERNLEILDAMESVAGWFREKGKAEQYHAELEALTVFHAYLTASCRVLRIDPASPVLGQLRDYTVQHYPKWKQNPYVRDYPLRHKLILLLLQKRCYRIIRWMFSVKG